MDQCPVETALMARRSNSRRAMSLLELIVVVVIFGFVAIASISRYGHSSISNGGAEGFARKLSLALIHARRATISTGENHYLQFSPTSGNATSFALFRRTGSGHVQVDETRSVPQGVTVTSAASELEFDFEGAALAGYSVSIAGPDRSWNVGVVMLTGAVQVSETTP